MEKKVIHLDKGNSFYRDQTIYFGTKHKKEEALQPLLQEIGIHCLVSNIDTDQFGTFSGEIKRVDSIRKTLTQKINEVFKLNSHIQLALASEGSFGPHPLIPFMYGNHETLLFVDKDKAIEIYVEDFSFHTNLKEIEINKGDEGLIEPFFTEIKFPDHAIMLKTSTDIFFKYTGIQDKKFVLNFINHNLTNNNKVIMATDMRAMFNPTRMNNIHQVGKKLVNSLQSYCPGCQMPGYSICEYVPGLECSLCGADTNVIKEEIWNCKKCQFTEKKERKDQLKYASPSECNYCNP